MGKNEQRPFYFEIPVEMIRNLYSHRTQAVREMLNYGLYRFSQKFDVGHDTASRIVLYDYYRHPERLPNDIKVKVAKVIEEYGEWILIDEDHGDIFTAEGEISEEVVTYFYEACDDSLICELCDYAKYRNAYDIVKNFDGEFWEYQDAHVFYNSIEDKTPYFTISVKALRSFKYRNTEDYYRFGLLCAIRSIVGAKEMAKSNKNMVIARALGCRSPKDVENLKLKNPDKQHIFAEVESRKKFDKRMTILNYSGYISKIHLPGEHCFYLGTKGWDELKLAIMKMKALDMKEKVKRDHDKAVKEILAFVNKGTS